MINLKSLIEGKNDYEVYHSSYSSAVQEAERYANRRGYKVDEDDWWKKIAMGNKKPSNGKTNSATIELTKDGKPNASTLSLQVYNRGIEGNTYELNCYLNISNKKVK